MKYLFDSWTDFEGAIKQAGHVLLLADYDGTLTPIAGRPQDAILSPAVADKLRALVRKPGFTVGIISGRELNEAKKLVGVEGIYYAGNHGLNIEGPGLNYTNPIAERARTVMQPLVAELRARMKDIAGVIIEDKGLSLSVHYRLVRKGQEGEVARIFREITAAPEQAGKVRITAGKKVWEVRPPVDWDKGKAVDTIRREAGRLTGKGNILTIYLGDDTTDEDAFRVVHRPGGWSIFVGEDNSKSAAEYFLKSTDEAGAFLDRLLALK